MNIDVAWEYIEKFLFNKTTYMIYDHKHTVNDEFPTPEEISRQWPNPCGYGTGMEDGMINGATMLDACLLRYEKKGDKSALEFAGKIKDGMLRCVSCAKSEGFVPRAVTPRDSVSCYTDSSRDQYTMFLFAMHRWLNSEACGKEDCEKIKRVCIGIANRALKNVTEENGYDMLCDDGGKTLVSTMWGDGLGNHEYLRLPMIYIMAWQSSGDEFFLECYRKIRSEAYEKSLTMGKYWHLYTLQQMQASVLVCMENDSDIGWREKYLSLMNRIADYTEERVNEVRCEIESHTNYNMEQKGFRKCVLEECLRFENRGTDCKSVIRKDSHEFFILQDAAVILIVTALVPDRKPSENAVKLFEEAYSKIDFSKHERCVPVHFADGYFRSL